jgi:hypothetical protein
VPALKMPIKTSTCAALLLSGKKLMGKTAIFHPLLSGNGDKLAALAAK